MVEINIHDKVEYAVAHEHPDNHDGAPPVAIVRELADVSQPCSSRSGIGKADVMKSYLYKAPERGR
jgi:hypothetical protein